MTNGNEYYWNTAWGIARNLAAKHLHDDSRTDWELIAAMREEERQKALRLSSEAVKAARAKIEAGLKGSR